MWFTPIDQRPGRQATVAILATVLLAWASGSVLPVVVCHSGEGLTVELALEPCCPSPGLPGGGAILLVMPHDCTGCIDRPLSSLGTWSRPATEAGDAPADLAVDTLRPEDPPALGAFGRHAAPRVAEGPDERARILLPLLC